MQEQARQEPVHCLPKCQISNAWLCADRNEAGKKKHPEFSSLPVCRECFDLLGAAAWHLQGDWKDEAGHDKYCRFCAGSAPGGTSTLLHCAQDGCKKGFCTGSAISSALLFACFCQEKGRIQEIAYITIAVIIGTCSSMCV